jgi:hypothetical protein
VPISLGLTVWQFSFNDGQCTQAQVRLGSQRNTRVWAGASMHPANAKDLQCRHSYSYLSHNECQSTPPLPCTSGICARIPPSHAHMLCSRRAHPAGLSNCWAGHVLETTEQSSLCPDGCKTLCMCALSAAASARDSSQLLLLSHLHTGAAPGPITAPRHPLLVASASHSLARADSGPFEERPLQGSLLCSRDIPCTSVRWDMMVGISLQEGVWV